MTIKNIKEFPDANYIGQVNKEFKPNGFGSLIYIHNKKTFSKFVNGKPEFTFEGEVN